MKVDTGFARNLLSVFKSV